MKPKCGGMVLVVVPGTSCLQFGRLGLASLKGNWKRNKHNLKNPQKTSDFSVLLIAVSVFSFDRTSGKEHISLVNSDSSESRLSNSWVKF